MQLKIKRTQKMTGLVSKKPVFGLTFRADYSEDERAAINSYNIGGEVIYHTQILTVTIASLKAGHHIECPDLGTLLETEEAIHGACKNLKSYLNVAQTFNGQDEVFEF